MKNALWLYSYFEQTKVKLVYHYASQYHMELQVSFFNLSSVFIPITEKGSSHNQNTLHSGTHTHVHNTRDHVKKASVRCIYGNTLFDNKDKIHKVTVKRGCIRLNMEWWN